MQYYFIQFSPYLNCIGMLFYVFDAYFLFLLDKQADESAGFLRQNFWMFFVQVVSFVDLALVSKNLMYVFFYGFVQILLLFILLLTRLIYPKSNKLLLNNMCFLLGIGFIMMARLTYGADRVYEEALGKAGRQYLIAVISLAVCLFVPFLVSRIRFFKKCKWIYAGLGIAALGAVWILSETTNGSKITFTIQGLTFQPSEFVKIIYLFFLAAMLWDNVSFPRIFITGLLAAAHVIILVLSTDLGSALLYFVAYVLIVFVASKKFRYLLAGILGGALASMVAYQLFEHVRTRVLAWQDPWLYIDDQGYQITQSLFAISSGGWFGTGLLKGSPSSIPYVEADFIFSAICEEFGGIFAMGLILVCLSSFLVMMQMSLRITDHFYQLICFGGGILYMMQIFLTIGGGIKFIPLTGVTLPFVSYGGSSCMSMMLLFYILHGIYMRLEKALEAKEEERLNRKKKEGRLKENGSKKKKSAR